MLPEWMMAVWLRIKALVRRGRLERDLDDELAFHLAMREQKLVDEGTRPEEAHYAARRQFGNTTRAKETNRDLWTFPFLETLWQDLRYGLRQLRRNRGFTIVAVLTLALGIGANTAIFSMLNGILLRALPFPAPQRLYTISEVVPQWGGGYRVAAGNFLEWRANCRAFSALALMVSETVALKGAGSPRQVRGERVSAAFFPMLGIHPQLGRLFTPEEDQYGRNHEVILTNRLWRHEFGSDSRVIGEAVVLGGSQMTVVGVLPANFRFPKIGVAPEFFVPLGLRGSELRAGVGGFNFLAFARLKAGVSPKQALAQLNAVEASIARKHAGGKFNLHAILTPLKTAVVGPFARVLWLLMVAAGVVLLIICVNLANLMLARNTGRAHEIAVRSALGATPKRLARQLLTEASLLTSGGGALGLLVASWSLDLLVRNAPVAIPRVNDIQIDHRVLWFTLGVSTVAALLFALLPALRLARVQPAGAFRASEPAVSEGKSSVQLRQGLVIGEIALCGVLLAAALLLVASLDHVVKVNDWMDDQHVLTVSVTAPPGMLGLPEAKTGAQRNADFKKVAGERERFYSEVLQKVEGLPGVRAAGFTSWLPLGGDSWENGISFREAPRPDTETPLGDFRFVSPGYFQAIGLRLIRGRLLRTDDGGRDVALISESIARKLLSGRDPIGMHLDAAGSPPAWLRVIGVVGNVRGQSDDTPAFVVYEPLRFAPQPSEILVVRSAMGPDATAAAVRRVVSSVSSVAATSREQTLQTIVQTSEAQRRYETTLAALFALVAVLLAALGLYGVISYSVSQRTHEIGIRMALGAERKGVVMKVVRQGLKLALIGVVIGVGGALALTRFLSSLLYGVKPTDPLTFVAVSLILIAVASLACYIPARRAAKVDPIVALRYE